jgi:hypothetical protein
VASARLGSVGHVTTGRADDDAFWRRPAESTPQGPTPGADTPYGATPAPGIEAKGPPEYSGPPPTVAPPPGWRLPTVAKPAPARTLPVQDAAELDAEEQVARTLTYGVAMVASAIMLVVLLLICGRLLF